MMKTRIYRTLALIVDRPTEFKGKGVEWMGAYIYIHILLVVTTCGAGFITFLVFCFGFR